MGRRDGHNFGYGRQLSYAGPQALKDMFGGGQYGTVKTNCDRWQAFVKWCRSDQGPGINDARQINRKVLADYAAYLRDIVSRGDLAVSTAQTAYLVLTGPWQRFAVISMCNCQVRARRWVCSAPGFASRCHKARTANR